MMFVVPPLLFPKNPALLFWIVRTVPTPSRVAPNARLIGARTRARYVSNLVSGWPRMYTRSPGSSW